MTVAKTLENFKIWQFHYFYYHSLIGYQRLQTTTIFEKNYINQCILNNKFTSQEGHVVYFNNHVGFGYIIDNENRPIFFHLNSFSEKTYRTALINQKVRYNLFKTNDSPFNREHCVLDDSLIINKGKRNYIKNQIKSKHILKGEFNNFLNSEEKIIILKDIVFDFELNYTTVKIKDKIIFFLDCTFNKNVLFINCLFDESVFFLNCKFYNQFSFKDSIIKNDLHLEASYFEGNDGVSFRGLECKNIYFDFGINGPKEMVWLNELKVTNNLIISGYFQSPIQLHGDQDSNSKVSKINRIIIGKEYYNSQCANRTKINAPLNFSNIVTDKIEIINTEIENIQLNNIQAKNLTTSNIEVNGYFNISNTIFSSVNECCTIENCNISSKIIFRNDHFHGVLNLDSTVVDKLVLIEDCLFEKNGCISIYSLITDKFKITPPSLLFNNSKTFLTCPKFKLLKREKHFKSLTKKSRAERLKLADEYISLRNWFNKEGVVDFEDIAYYNQRSRRKINIFQYIFYKNIFGWGVRIWNLLWSSMMFILTFSIIYKFLANITITHSLLLSFQSFFGVIFGSWINVCPQVDNPLSIISLIVVFEEALGIVFITIFIGAYMRKLLR